MGEAGIRIIIVDDDRETRDLLALALGQEGFDVRQAANGLRLISSLAVDRPDVILMDVNMSWIDGFELCRAVKKNEDLAHIPVIFISGRTSSSDIRRGLEVGAVAYLTKPVDLEELARRIRELVPRGERAQ